MTGRGRPPTAARLVIHSRLLSLGQHESTVDHREAAAAYELVIDIAEGSVDDVETIAERLRVRPIR